MQIPVPQLEMLERICAMNSYCVSPDIDMICAIRDPNAQAHTAAAGPPIPRGLPKVAGTEPRTPSTETA